MDVIIYACIIHVTKTDSFMGKSLASEWNTECRLIQKSGELDWGFLKKQVSRQCRIKFDRT